MTLNQIISRFKSLALAHKQINHFYFGDMVEWLANGEVVYPAIFMDLPTGEINKTDKRTYFDFEIWFCDLCNVAERTRENELEAQSDLTSVAIDFKAMLEYSEYLKTWSVSEVSPLAYYEEEFLEDLVVSIKMTVRVGIKTDSNRCWIPVDDLPFEPEKNAMIVTNYIYTGVGTEGNALSVIALQNKTVLMLFKGDKLLKKVQEDPDENEFLKKVQKDPDENEFTFNGQTGDFLFGNDIETNQVIQILNR